MVSEALDNPELSQARPVQFILDLLDLTFAELFYGFMDCYNNYKDCCMDSKEHFETWTPEIFIKFT